MSDAAHRWSGWPGAWCLDCGCDDPYEIALADDRLDWDDEGNPVVSEELQAEIAPLLVCPEPGSKRHDPYAAAAAKRSASE
jgi:hypothetical protein